MSSQYPPKSSLLIYKKGEALDIASTKNSVTSLLSSHDGTEVIHHWLKKGTRWGMSPEEDGSNTLESIYILSGKVKVHTLNEDAYLEHGDFLAGQPVSEHLVITAIEDANFLYVSSKPVFHFYSSETKNLEKLAIYIEEKDGYTAEHCLRIRKLSMMVGEKLGLNSESLLKLNFGAFLHDIGKTEIPEPILLKPSSLDADEWVIMKEHTRYGADILRSTKIAHFTLAAEVVEQHHERYDGSGYPRGLRGNEITIEAAIVGVVDSFDAMTSGRVYSKARPKADALAEIKQLRGIKYHPEVVDCFLSIVEEI